MRAVRPVLHLAACWLTISCSDPLSGRRGALTLQNADNLLARATNAPPLHLHGASLQRLHSGSSEEFEGEDAPLTALVDTPASRELRLLVSDLRQQEALRHKGKREDGAIKANADMRNLSGLLPVFKPSGITSADVCRVVRHILRSGGGHLPMEEEEGQSARVASAAQLLPVPGKQQKHQIWGSQTRTNHKRLKVGHGGTLDPAASGVLVLGIGSGTVALQSFLNGPKEYAARIRLGVETDTLDADGIETRRAPWEHISYGKLVNIISSFEGQYMQRPPLFSAKRVLGRRLYKAARSGSSSVNPEDRPAPCLVTIESLKLHRRASVKLPEFEISVRCSKGTYVRQLAADIAAAAGSVAHLRLLVRSRQGPIELESCMPFQGIPSEGLLHQHIIPLETGWLKPCKADFAADPQKILC
ncbi:hypothetical protein Efla_003888 [Eimeria flavescens]